MTATRKTVRVFISSTFRDMHAERDHLVTVVFPELRERIEQLGLEFFDVDLRWGVPQMGVDGEHANSWEYCKRWIDRVEPFFVSILGQRYGWTPPPSYIQDGDDRVRYAGQSITEMEIRHAVFDRAHFKRSFFYLRRTPVPGNTAPEVYDDFVDSAHCLKLDALKEQIRVSGRPVREYDCRWTGAGFADLEAFGRTVLEDLWSGVLRDSRYVPKEAWRQALGRDPDQDMLFCDDAQAIPQPVWDKIVQVARPEPRDPLDAEAEQMATFASARLRWFQGREQELEELLAFANDLRDDASRFCVIRAVAGQGKSAFLAKFAEVLATSPHLLITHFIGATERSADVRPLLERLIQELDRNGVPFPEKEEQNQDLESLAKRLALRLEKYCENRRIIIVIDALDQLTGGHDLSWLPHCLGPQVRIIVSCIAGATGQRENKDSASLDLSPALSRFCPRWVDLQPLTQAHVRPIVNNYLAEYCKELDPDQIDAICQMEQARNPLYLLVMLRELRTLGGQDMNLKVPGIIAQLPHTCPDAVRLFDWMLARLEVFGQDIVRLWCLYLALGRAGMSSRELSDLLARRLGPDAAHTGLLVERGIRPYLQRRGPQWDFFHGQLRQAVVRRYLLENDAPYHAEIAEYFASRLQHNDRHALSELPYHQTCGKLWAEVQSILCDLAFVEAKCAAGMSFELVTDYDRAMQSIPELNDVVSADIERKLALERYSHRLESILKAGSIHENDTPHMSAFIQKKQKVLRDRQSPQARPISAFAEFVRLNAASLQRFGALPGYCVQEAWNHADSGPVRDQAMALVPERLNHCALILRDTGSSESVLPRPRQILNGHTKDVTSVVISPAGDRAASASFDGTVRIWDVRSGRILNTIHAGDMVGGLAANLSGDTLATFNYWAGMSGTRNVWDPVMVWSAATGQRLHVLDERIALDGVYKVLALGTSHESDVAISPLGHHVAFFARDQHILVWEIPAEKCIAHIRTEGGLDYEKAQTVETNERNVKIIDVDSQISYEGRQPVALSLTADGRTVMLARGYTLYVYDVASAAWRQKMEHESDLTCLTCTPDGRCIVTGDEQQAIHVWDSQTGRQMAEVCLMTGTITSLAMTPDGHHILAGTSRGMVHRWDGASQEPSHSFQAHTGAVNRIAVTADGRTVFTAGDTFVKVWDMEDLKDDDQLQVSLQPPQHVAVSSDGLHAAFGGGFNRVRNYKLDIRTLREAESTGHVILWNTQTGQPTPLDGTYEDGVEHLLFLHRGRQLVVAGVAGSPEIWSVGSEEVQHRLQFGINDALEISPDEKRLVVMSRDGNVTVYSTANGKASHALYWIGGANRFWEHVVVSPDGRYVYCGSLAPAGMLFKGPETDVLWDIEKGNFRTGFDVSSTASDWTPDGRFVVSGAMNDVWVIRVADGKTLMTLTGHTDIISVVRVASDGRRAVSGSLDGTLRVWDLASGKCKHILSPGEERISNITLTPDGHHLMCDSDDGVLRSWDLHTGACTTVVSPPDGVRAYGQGAGMIVFGDGKGSMFAGHMAGLNVGAPYATATRLWRFSDRGTGRWDKTVTVLCPWCGERFPAPPSFKNYMPRAKLHEPPCIALPAHYWDREDLQASCPMCHRGFKLTPFTCDNHKLAVSLPVAVIKTKKARGRASARPRSPLPLPARMAIAGTISAAFLMGPGGIFLDWWPWYVGLLLVLPGGLVILLMVVYWLGWVRIVLCPRCHRTAALYWGRDLYCPSCERSFDKNS